MSTKSKSTPRKATSAAPLVKKSSKITSKPSLVQSPKLSSPLGKKSTELKPSELQAERNVVQEDLKKAKEKLILVEREKVQAIEEVKKANEKLREALVAKNLAEENAAIEKSRADEIEQAGIKAAQKKEEAWQKELEALRNQHALDVAALLSASEELQRVKQELARQKSNLEELEHRAKEEASEMAKKVESLMSELEAIKAEKNQATANEKLAEDRVHTLLEEKIKLVNNLDALKEEEDKSKKAIERLTSAMDEVSSKAREANERLLASQAEYRQCETEMEDLKLALQATNEKYEKMLDEAKEKIDALTKSVEQSKDEHQKLKAEWEEKELHLMSCIKITEERNSSMEKEVDRLLDLLRRAEKEAQLNEELRIREAASLKKVEDLSKLLQEALANKEAEENAGLSDCEKDYDMLPKLVEFSEENGGVGVEKPKNELLHHLSDQPIEVTPKVDIISPDASLHTSVEDSTSNGKMNENENKEEEDDASAKGEVKMWESCKIEDEDFSPESKVEQEMELKADVGESNDQVNGLSSRENLENGITSPIEQQSEKKKKPFLHKFGSLLKKKSSSNSQK